MARYNDPSYERIQKQKKLANRGNIMKIKKVLLRAPLLTNSGYGVHSRQIFAWLYTRKEQKRTEASQPLEKQTNAHKNG